MGYEFIYGRGFLFMSFGLMRPFARISLEGIPGSGLGAFMWSVEGRYARGDTVWTSGSGFSRALDGDSLRLDDWLTELSERLVDWEGGGDWEEDVGYIYYERSVWSLFVFAQWVFGSEFGLTPYEYNEFKMRWVYAVSQLDLPDLVVYFECLPCHSPLPKDHYWIIDDLYQTWLSLLESKGVKVLCVQSPKVLELDREYWAEKLMDKVEAMCPLARRIL